MAQMTSYQLLGAFPIMDPLSTPRTHYIGALVPFPSFDLFVARCNTVRHNLKLTRNRGGVGRDN